MFEAGATSVFEEAPLIQGMEMRLGIGAYLAGFCLGLPLRLLAS
jgi:hypothetical protein